MTRHGKRKRTSALLWDKWPTWERLAPWLSLGECCRRGLRCGASNVDKETRSGPDDAGLCAAGVLLVLMKEALGMRIAGRPARNQRAGALPGLNALLLQFGQRDVVVVHIDPDFRILPGGLVRGAHPCQLTVPAPGKLDLRDLKAGALALPDTPWSPASASCIAAFEDFMDTVNFPRTFCNASLAGEDCLRALAGPLAPRAGAGEGRRP